jgi:HPt (histidine-containing phosphotransfer) domain-containing protein
VIDRGKLAEQTFGDPDIRREVLVMFTSELPALLQALAMTAGVARSAVAHRLKGSALAIGADSLAEAAAALDATPDEPGLMTALEAAAALVAADISQLLRE